MNPSSVTTGESYCQQLIEVASLSAAAFTEAGRVLKKIDDGDSLEPHEVTMLEQNLRVLEQSKETRENILDQIVEDLMFYDIGQSPISNRFASFLPLIQDRFGKISPDKLWSIDRVAGKLQKLEFSHSTIMQVFINIVENGSDELRDEAIRELKKMGTDAANAAPALIKLLPELRETVVSTLQVIAPGSPLLIDALKNGDTLTRQHAAMALCEKDTDSKDVINALSEALRDPDRSVRLQAAESLSRIGPNAKAALPAVMIALNDEDIYVRGHAAIICNSFGLEAVNAIPLLVKAIKVGSLESNISAHRDIVYWSLSALGKMGLHGLPHLITALDIEAISTRRSVAILLSLFSFRTPLLVEKLVSISHNDPDDHVRQHALSALRKLSTRELQADIAIHDVTTQDSKHDRDSHGS